MRILVIRFSILIIVFISLTCEPYTIPTPVTWTCGDMIFHDEKIYSTIQIGNQCWLKENLDIGSMIQWNDTAFDNGIIEKYCYDNDTANCNTYGGLYQWTEAMQYSTIEGSQGICPSGWHVPTYLEFQTLRILVDSNGNALKAIGQGIGDGAGTNISGFSALLSGFRLWNRSFYGLNYITKFWSSVRDQWDYPYGLGLYYSDSLIFFGAFNDKELLSVRCLKDE